MCEIVESQVYLTSSWFFDLFKDAEVTLTFSRKLRHCIFAVSRNQRTEMVTVGTV